MRAHHFAVGDHVLYTERRFPHLVCKQPYTIVGCLDSRRFEPQYQIRSETRLYDCVAGEDELSRGGSPMSAFRNGEVPDFLDGTGTTEPANLNLVPWTSLPRRARHKNEEVCALRHRQA
ncbi:hypothetical protein HPT29_016965 [Microvirga terrae]|uniref:Uncharacterized protein n=1 Tax=Microvirga terrae TaxID=2740529 RepID=A0ABY5RMS7_9HYPH|nr:hypothetical protein [Microvirga terrae]UVF18194.1 hypothetical protein HPT29_016965 [Microvirga terrae]